MSAFNEPECLGVCTFEEGVCAACGRTLFEEKREEAAPQAAGPGDDPGTRRAPS